MKRSRSAVMARVCPVLVVLFGGLGGHALAGEAADLRRDARAIEDRFIDVIQRVEPAVVAVFRPGPAGQGQGGAGSGVLIDPEGFALTNYHVVGQLREVRCGLPDGRIYPARVVGRDPTGDIALLKLSGQSAFPFVPLGDSNDLAIGEWAIAMGNPFNLATDFKPTVTLGIISGLNRYLAGREDNTLIYTNSIQVDTPINPGNSGGPLFNAVGELIGINGRIAGRPTRGRVNVGTGFAISINQIKRFLPALREGRDVYHAQLGVKVDADQEGGAVTVTEVLPDSAALEAGLKVGDVILLFDGQPVLSRQHLTNMIGVLPAGTDVVIRIARGGKEHNLDVELGGLPAGSGVLAGRGQGKAVVESAPPAMPQDPTTVEAILQAYVAARGGADAIGAIKATKTLATAVIHGQRRVEADVMVYEKRPNKVRTELVTQTSRTVRSGNETRTVTQTIKEVRGYDGVEGWVQRPPAPAAAMPGNDREEIRQGFVEDLILNHGARPKGVTLTYLGESTIGETPVHVVHAKGDSLGTRWWFFDRDAHLLVRIRHRALTSGLWRIEDLSDYRPVEGVQMPFRFETYTGGRLSSEVTVKTITVAPDLEEALFKAP